ncbi:dihydropteroate synthase [Kerstersia similis]|uniref:dihydropteroate synthase n=1 Tax=Kerstersia similis TaxID=206505 RepID=UPI0039EEFC4F
MVDTLLCGRFELVLKRPLVMGIVNTTPDSFSDGGLHDAPEQAIAHAWQLLEAGADILDIGGESTRPGAQPVAAAEELERVLPVVRALQGAGVPLSVDTCKPEVMRRVLDAGADMINDIAGFSTPEAVAAVAQSDCGLCVMHMQGEPRTMQQAPVYQDVVHDIAAMLAQRVAALEAAGVARERICLDPGFGFGKTADQNYELLHRLPELLTAGMPLLVGLSRKTMIGAATGRPVTERMAGSIAGALACVARGAKIIRVHDVAATRDALNVWLAAEQGSISK